MTPLTRELLNAPPNEWEERASKLNDMEKQDVEHDLSALIQRATLLESYVSHRWNTGCGDQGHNKAAKKANKTLTAVRRALGYSYPDRTPLRLP